MKRLAIYIYSILHVTVLAAQDNKQITRPKLVIGIVIDQMRWDYLYKYYDRYSDNGFKRLMNDGFNCENTLIDYLPSFTAPGHATIYTGSVPALHGIAANDWIEKGAEKLTYCVSDNSVSSIGGSVKAGKMSPENLYATTITDELRIVTKGRGKVFGVGIKDRGSILPAGHAANGAFWFDDSTGNFITSSYYMNELPDWLVKFNNKRWADTLINKTWTLLDDTYDYVHSTPDNTSFEGKLKGEQAPVFPHKVKYTTERGYCGLRYMPAGNTITLKAAKACIKGEELGKDDITDFLCITLSTTDYAGHNYGPDAKEMEDMYIRLDSELAFLIKNLDKQVGSGNYTLFLTADHGAAHNARYMRSMKIPAGSETQAESTNRLNEHLKKQTGKDSLITLLYNYQVYFNEAKILQSGVDKGKVRLLTTAWLQEQEGVAFVVDLENLGNAAVPEPLRSMVINGYSKDRSGSLQIIMKPGWYSGHGKTGTTHGTWNPYDTHIPLLWYGHGIKKGKTYRTINMTDIAPTLAALLHIQMPNASVGKVIAELIE